MKADGIWANIFHLATDSQPLGEILQHIPLFHDLTPKELRILERVVHVRTYRPEETVFLEDEPGAGVYIIRFGRVDIVLNHGSHTPVPLAEMEPGDFFGEMALLGDSTRSATAVAREQCELIGFFHPDLLEIINLHPVMGAKITFGLAKTLAKRLRYTNSQLREISGLRGLREEPIR
jgi:CRP/FNR family transcriptional regulator, cyclic AMP receptor protein